MTFEVGVNTYMTVEEADSIIEDEFDNDEEVTLWNTLDEKGKQRVILKGTRKIDSMIWVGIRQVAYQNLSWPRFIQGRVKDCPYDIKVGILKQAIKDKINDSKQEIKLQELGVKSYSIKGASITFDNKNKERLNNGVYDEVYREYLVNWLA